MKRWKQRILLGILMLIYSVLVSLIIAVPFRITSLLSYIVKNESEAAYFSGLISVVLLFVVSERKCYLLLKHNVDRIPNRHILLVIKIELSTIFGLMYHFPMRTMAYALSLIATIIQHLDLINQTQVLPSHYSFQYTLLFLIGLDALQQAWNGEKNKALNYMEKDE